MVVNLRFALLSCLLLSAEAFALEAGKEVHWERSAVSADVDCDGKVDQIQLGYDQNRAWVRVETLRKPHTFSLPKSTDSAYGLAAFPVKVRLENMDCTGSEGTPLAGCRPVKRCRAFRLDDGMTDAIHVYWNAKQQQFNFWRL